MPVRINPDMKPGTAFVSGPVGRTTITTNPSAGSSTGKTAPPPRRLPVEPVKPTLQGGLQGTVGTAVPKGGTIATAPFARPTGASVVHDSGFKSESLSPREIAKGNLAAIRAFRLHKGKTPWKSSPRRMHEQG